MSDHPYRFKGMPEFVVKEGLSSSFASRIPSSYFISRLADALSQIPEARPEHRAAIYETARGAILALDACLKTALAAYDQVMAHCPPLPSEDDPKLSTVDPIAAMRKVDPEPEPIAVDPEPEPKPRRGPGRPKRISE